LEQLRVRDSEFWAENSQHVLRMLHKYKAKDFAQFIDLFQREIVDETGEPVLIYKTDDIFFEKLAGLLPMYIKDMSNAQVIRTLEVCVARNVGSQRLFDHYMLFMIEKHVLSYKVSEYSRMVRALAEKGFVEDYVFWDKFAFRYVFHDPRTGGERKFNNAQAKTLWDTFVFLKLKCPVIDIKDVLVQLEKFIEIEKIEAKASE